MFLLKQPQILIFTKRKGGNNDLYARPLKELKVIRQPIIPPWARNYGQPDAFRFYPIWIHKSFSN
jgi:hypothetical protein